MLATKVVRQASPPPPLQGCGKSLKMAMYPPPPRVWVLRLHSATTTPPPPIQRLRSLAQPPLPPQKSTAPKALRTIFPPLTMQLYWKFVPNCFDNHQPPLLPVRFRLPVLQAHAWGRAVARQGCRQRAGSRLCQRRSLGAARPHRGRSPPQRGLFSAPFSAVLWTMKASAWCVLFILALGLCSALECDMTTTSTPFDTDTCIDECAECFSGPEWDTLKAEVGVTTEIRAQRLKEAPDGITVGYLSWPSAFLLAQVTDILLREMMGYKTVPRVDADPLNILRCTATRKVTFSCPTPNAPPPPLNIFSAMPVMHGVFIRH